jgi:methanogenic corrinoid protein MtbC1
VAPKPGNLVRLDRDAFERSRVLFDADSGPLPRDALHSLAQQVVARLAQRAKQDERIRAVIPPADEIERFCDALVSDDEHAGADLILQVRTDGASIETVYLGYVAKAADRLGVRWAEDEISFVEMTIAAGRMLGILRGLRHVIAARHTEAERCALFATAPDEHHFVGINIIADLLRRDGWEIQMLVGMDQDELLVALEGRHFPVIGLSASTAKRRVELAELIVALRISSPASMILLGGQINLQEPGLWERIGADAGAADFETARVEMNRLLKLYQRRV